MFLKIRYLYTIYRLIQNPDKLKEVLDLAEIATYHTHPEKLVEYEREILEIPGFRTLYESGDKTLIEDPYNIDDLLALPERTLGYEFANHMKENRLSSEFYTHTNTATPMQYLRNRLLKTHDIIHVMTGFDTSEDGEVGVQAFYLAQYSSPVPLAILGGGLINLVVTDRVSFAEDRMEKIVRGYKMGKHAKNILFVKWEQYFNKNIDEIRSEFNLTLG